MPAWRWLQNVVETLGRDGTSSDESEGEPEDPGRVFTTKKMTWRRNMTKELTILDKERFQDKFIFRQKGSKPTPRIRRADGPETVRSAPHGLPRQFYDDDWYDALPMEAKRKLECFTSTTQDFVWLDIVAESM